MHQVGFVQKNKSLNNLLNNQFNGDWSIREVSGDLFERHVSRQIRLPRKQLTQSELDPVVLCQVVAVQVYKGKEALVESIEHKLVDLRIFYLFEDYFALQNWGVENFALVALKNQVFTIAKCVVEIISKTISTGCRVSKAR